MHFRSNGKLMITGEYLVLAGARALAMPVRYGQTLDISPSPGITGIHWRSLIKDKPWLDVVFRGESFEPKTHAIDDADHASVRFVQQTLSAAKKIKPGFLSQQKGWKAMACLEFDKSWGLGSSSSLISNIAYWAATDPYELFFELSKGSGYDMACARSQTPIIYTFTGYHNKPLVQQVEFSPVFHKHLFFIYSGQKQDSAKSIANFNALKIPKIFTESISRITDHIIHTDDLHDFIQSLLLHESVTARATGLNPIQKQHYQDFPGVVKSLGAWGGDFLLAAAEMPPDDIKRYFKEKNARVIIPFNEMQITPGVIE